MCLYKLQSHSNNLNSSKPINLKMEYMLDIMGKQFEHLTMESTYEAIATIEQGNHVVTLRDRVWLQTSL